MRHALLLLLLGCSSSNEPPTSKAAPPALVKCLPVVAKECGCVYDCGTGTSTDGKTWHVRHAFWKDTELTAVVEPWCVGGACTDAFAAQIVCDGICAPKPARTDCTCK